MSGRGFFHAPTHPKLFPKVFHNSCQVILTSSPIMLELKVSGERVSHRQVEPLTGLGEMTEMRAKIIGTTDANQAQRFEDEHGGQWIYYTDDCCGNIAVNACDDEGDLLSSGGAGVFAYTGHSETEGEIHVKTEGEHFGVNYENEFMVADGEWKENLVDAEF